MTQFIEYSPQVLPPVASHVLPGFHPAAYRPCPASLKGRLKGGTKAAHTRLKGGSYRQEVSGSVVPK
jgi:hypothetical protein